MPCYDERIDQNNKINRYAAGLLCEALKVMRGESAMTSDLQTRLDAWFVEHVKSES